MHKASPVELRTVSRWHIASLKLESGLCQYRVETDEEFHTLATSLSQKLEMMVAKAEADERAGYDNH